VISKVFFGGFPRKEKLPFRKLAFSNWLGRCANSGDWHHTWRERVAFRERPKRFSYPLAIVAAAVLVRAHTAPGERVAATAATKDGHNSEGL
jgi:hypothetical protein